MIEITVIVVDPTLVGIAVKVKADALGVGAGQAVGSALVGRVDGTVAHHSGAVHVGVGHLVKPTAVLCNAVTTGNNSNGRVVVAINKV